MSEREKYDAVGLAKNMAWQRAKGELMSIIAAEGSKYGEDLKPLRKSSEMIERFIKAFEEEEYHL